MFLKDQLKDTYQKASLNKNNFVLENVINKWAHRFGVQSLNELIVEDQEQINLREEDQEQINLIEEDQEQINLIEEDQDQVNCEILKNLQNEEEKKSKPNEELNNNEIFNKEIYDSSKNNSKYMEKEELPLPEINNLRKWISNEKRAS